jgi:hypothetical protein
MKKNRIFPVVLALVAMFLFSCVDYNLPTPSEAAATNNQYLLKVNSSTVATNDTIYGSVTSEILFFVTTIKDSLVAVQCDFGDGGIDGGTQVLHQYKVAGVYKLKVTVVSTNTILNRVVKISAPSVSVGETIVQLSGNTIGDSASITLLCRKDKIYNYGSKGKYFLKGDMTSWKTAITTVDTNVVYQNVVYVQFTFKVKNSSWTSFGYYKIGNDLSEHWSYDPSDKFWDTTKNLYKIYVANAKIYPNQLSALTPGSCGDPSNLTSGATIRLDYETNGTASDSLVIYANRNYLGNDSTKMGFSYAVDGGTTIIKKARFLKNTNYIYTRVPVIKSSTVRFKTYKDLAGLITGDISSSIFYDTVTQDCYLTIAGTIQKISGQNSACSGLKIITPNGSFLIN